MALQQLAPARGQWPRRVFRQSLQRLQGLTLRKREADLDFGPSFLVYRAFDSAEFLLGTARIAQPQRGLGKQQVRLVEVGFFLQRVFQVDHGGAVSRGAKFEWLTLQCRVEGTLERVDGQSRITRFATYATLSVPAGADAARVAALLERAEHGCLIANSLHGTRTLETEVVKIAPG